MPASPARIATLMAVLLIAAPARAQLPGLGAPGPESGEALVSTAVHADVATIGPGQRFHLAVVFDLEPGWHIYWINAGASGLPTHIEVEAPKGYVVGEVRWPRPRIFRGPEGMTYGFEKQVVAFIPVTAPNDVKQGEATFDVEASWLVCKVACLMGSMEQSVAVATTSEPADRGTAASALPGKLESHRARLPKKLADLPGAEIRLDGSRLTISGSAAGFAKGEFFPAPVPGVRFGRTRLQFADDRFTLEAEVEIEPGNARGRQMIAQGIVALGTRPEDPAYEFRRPIEAAEAGAGAAK